ncbi:hypothetical protein C4K18_0737 [Pseudomonas chlororaphis subsp. aurantiaca]|nr:hypothetical protein C4K18_0737 [Pseudomonas chlororaphis subsp. aurantiaca]
MLENTSWRLKPLFSGSDNNHTASVLPALMLNTNARWLTFNQPA